jgi:hypothetical protein
MIGWLKAKRSLVMSLREKIEQLKMLCEANTEGAFDESVSGRASANIENKLKSMASILRKFVDKLEPYAKPKYRRLTGKHGGLSIGGEEEARLIKPMAAMDAAIRNLGKSLADFESIVTGGKSRG